VRQQAASTALLDREPERRALDELLAHARTGRGAVLVLRGEAGIGKSELINHVLDQADDFHILRSAGAQSEMELPYAGLHQLCAPLLSGLAALPGPQRSALGTAFGVLSGEPPDRFLVSLAALTLLAHAGATRPLLCIVDDAHWLDQASALALGFVARRLVAEPMALVFAVRDSPPDGALAGLPELVLTGLPEGESLTLLNSVARGPLDQRVRDRIMSEARGNPLALLELPRNLSAVELADPHRQYDERALTGQLEHEFLRRFESLPAKSRRLLAIAAAEPLGDVLLLRQAATRLGIDVDAAVSPAESSDLLTVGTRVEFRHPLVRSAIYRAATPADRREAHDALAEATDAAVDPDRRAWHRGQAAASADEEVASELEDAARRAHTRGAIASAATFLDRSAALTPDPARRAERALDAAQAKVQAGEYGSAVALLVVAEDGPPDQLRRARLDGLRASLAFAENRGNEAPALLLAAARRLEKIDVRRARETYLEAIAAAVFAGRFGGGSTLREIAEAARASLSPPHPGPPDRLLDAVALRLTDGRLLAAPAMKQVLAEFRDSDPTPDTMRWLWLATVLASDLWDDEAWDVLASRHVALAREAGALSEVSLALDSLAAAHLVAGELSDAAILIEETARVDEITGGSAARVLPLGLAAFRGREDEARILIDSTLSEAKPLGQGAAVSVTSYFHAVLCNGLGLYHEATTAAQIGAQVPWEFGVCGWANAELAEAAARSGAAHIATGAVEQHAEEAQASGTDWAHGVQARVCALVTDGPGAEDLYVEAIRRLERTRARMDRARAHLVYGEWLRREGRRTDARGQLSTAHELLAQMGAMAFAERAARELKATGAAVRPPSAPAPSRLTPQEEQIARLVADGLTNPEIAARMYLSHHTVEWHLRKVFTKLDVTSRRDISASLLSADT
jgi:DNA-binding CsgD family transcriptional regulator